MKFKILVNKTNNKGFKWYSLNNIFVKGSFFDNKNNYYEKENLLNYFDNCFGISDFEDRIKQANGVFSVIIKQDNCLFAATDIIRMFPLFYKQTENSFIITDQIESINEAEKINNFSLNEILFAGFVTGDRTIYNSIKQLQAGELIFYEKQKLSQTFYHSYLKSKKIVLNNQVLNIDKKAVSVFENVFQRLVKSLQNKTAIVPLSGGFDSRLIATMLRKNNYKDVICYTYGAKNAKDLPISEKVAKQLGFKWYYIEYNEKLFANFLYDDIYRKYCKYTTQNITFPFFQEYFAVKYLKENNLVPENAVFIPGHVGDNIGGSNLRATHNNANSSKKISNLILEKYYNLNTTTNNDKVKILEILNEYADKYFDDYQSYSIIENWNLTEKQSKLTTNTANVYNYFGYEHRLPYWDLELTNFFKNIVPFKSRLYKTFFNQILSDKFFNEYNLNFESELQASSHFVKKQEVKNRIKKYLPNKIVLKYTKKTNWLNSNLLSNQLIEFLGKQNIKINTKVKYNNEITIQWYIKCIINKLF